MPPISPIKPLAQVLFAAKQHKLPCKKEYKKPPDGSQYRNDALGLTDWIATPKVVPPLFTPQDPQKYHQQSCDDIGGKWKEFMETMIDAVKFSHDLWKLQAKVKDLKVMAVSAIGPPGCLDGPTLESNIKNFPGCAAWTGNAGKLRDAVAKGVSECFEKWQGKVMVPGLPWYPAFAAFPGPQAPPMPNVPMPLITCPSAMMAEITVPKRMQDAMIKALDKSVKDKDADKIHETAFECIATVLSMAFLMWMPSQQVMLVMGKGPIPTFAPPYVPVGPVVAGDNIAAPGHLMA